MYEKIYIWLYVVLLNVSWRDEGVCYVVKCCEDCIFIYGFNYMVFCSNWCVKGMWKWGVKEVGFILFFFLLVIVLDVNVI